MIDITTEPRGEIYLALLQLAKQHSPTFSLVWRDQFSYREAPTTTEHSLQTFLIQEIPTDEWPGTKLLGHKARVRFYCLTDDSLAVLAKLPSLYSWLFPEPEDLAFYTLGGRCLLMSIAHEKEAAFVSNSISVEDLQAAIS
jgi:hypothetical protein